MQFKGMNLCDFCFEPLGPGNVCSNCGLTHETYRSESGLLEPGTILLGKYIVGRVLGRGGFGATYLAYSSERDKVVAIKEYYPTGIANRAKGEESISIVSNDKREVFEKGAHRFFEEAKTMSKFNTNKNVVSVYEFFYANDTVYYSMEYLEGIDLKGYTKKKGGRLAEAEAVTIMKGVCEALVAVHSTQTLHRDISPDNIFICTDGGVKLIDFGAAKQVISSEQREYSVVVKQGFAPLEQYNSKGNQGVWTDIYAVGGSIYYAVTGKIPPSAIDRVENPEIVFDRTLNLSPKFMNIIKKCLQKRIEDRYQSAIELLGDLKELNYSTVQTGGSTYVQDVFNMPSHSTGISGENVSFEVKSDGNVGTIISQNQTIQKSGFDNYPPSQYSPSQYPQSNYVQSQYVESYASKKEKSGLMMGLFIGAASLIIVVLLIVLCVTIFSPDRNQRPGPGPNDNMMGQQDMMGPPPNGGGQPPMGR